MKMCILIIIYLHIPLALEFKPSVLQASVGARLLKEREVMTRRASRDSFVSTSSCDVDPLEWIGELTINEKVQRLLRVLFDKIYS